MIQPQQPLDPGVYRAALFCVQSLQYDGAKWEWHFDVRDQGGEVRRVIARTSSSMQADSKAHMWISALLGRRPEKGESIDTDEFNGVQCLVTVDLKKGKNRVVSVLPSEASPTFADAIAYVSRQKIVIGFVPANYDVVGWLPVSWPLEIRYNPGESGPTSQLIVRYPKGDPRASTNIEADKADSRLLMSALDEAGAQAPNPWMAYRQIAIAACDPAIYELAGARLLTLRNNWSSLDA